MPLPCLALPHQLPTKRLLPCCASCCSLHSDRQRGRGTLFKSTRSSSPCSSSFGGLSEPVSPPPPRDVVFVLYSMLVVSLKATCCFVWHVGNLLRSVYHMSHRANWLPSTRRVLSVSVNDSMPMIQDNRFARTVCNFEAFPLKLWSTQAIVAAVRATKRLSYRYLSACRCAYAISGCCTMVICTNSALFCVV